jgi:hypothetical protein
MLAKTCRKSFILAALCVVKAATAPAQGTVYFGNYWLGGASRVYLPSPAHPGLVQIGNGPSEKPPGTTDWTGWTLVSGAGFSAQLFGIGGANAPVDSLAP